MLNVNKFIECLGICHTIITEEKTHSVTKQKFINYNASSPDELALVNGARHFGFGFYERDENGFIKVKLTRQGDKETKF